MHGTLKRPGDARASGERVLCSPCAYMLWVGVTMSSDDLCAVSMSVLRIRLVHQIVLRMVDGFDRKALEPTI